MVLVETIFGKIIIPAVYYLRGDLRFKYYSEYKRNLKKSRAEIEAYQLERLRKIIRHAYNTTEYYRKLLDSIKLSPDDIKSVQDVKKIPPISKATVIDKFDELKSSSKIRSKECVSGGSTGQRMIMLQDDVYRQKSRAAWMRDMLTIGFKPGHKIAWFWGAEMDNTPVRERFLNRLLWKINRRITFNTFRYSHHELKDFLTNKFNKFKPDFIYGYAEPLHDIAEFIRQNNIQIHKVRAIISTAERLENRQHIEEVFGAKVIDHYGCRECITIAIEDWQGKMHSSDDTVFAEVDSNGEIIITPLESYAMPLIRYKNGDIGAVKTQEDDVSYPFKPFSIRVGRSSEMLYHRDGSTVMAPFIGFLAADQRLNTGEFQLIQRKIGDVELKLVKNKKTKPQDIEKLKSIIVKMLGETEIKTTFVDRFPIEKSGKKISFKCLVK